MVANLTSDSGMSEIAGGVGAPNGFAAAGVHAGIKRRRKDIAIIFSDTPCVAAGVFTTNRVQAAPVVVTKERLAAARTRAVVVNSGNANVCNGEQGVRDAVHMCQLAGDALGVPSEEVLVASTGVIGYPLPMDKIAAGIAAAARDVRPGGAADAALGILTTDTRPKEIALSINVDGRHFRIGGMAKGSGMIHPNMATMLAFITTDAPVEKEFLQSNLKEAVDASFNLISVDGDTSTNDMVLALANGTAGGPPIEPGSRAGRAFQQALHRVSVALAKMIAADGEGATKLIEVEVTGARDGAEARSVVRAVTRSPLVKTAVHGEDANWGRIICAVGYSGAAFDLAEVAMHLGDVQVCERGQGLPFDESAASEALSGDEVHIRIDLGTGAGRAVGWTCDLTADYVRINGGYRT